MAGVLQFPALYQRGESSGGRICHAGTGNRTEVLEGKPWEQTQVDALPLTEANPGLG